MCEKAGVPAVLVLTEVFVNLGAAAAQARGFSGLRQLVLPHPMETRAADEIVTLARARLGEVVRHLTRPA